jgi:aminoglycoside phosphotransferase (APT) family kinase protein
MHFIDFRSTLNDLAGEELAPYGAIQRVEFLHRNHTDVYRVRTSSASLIAHASSEGKSYLKRVRENLELLASLEDPRIPRMLAWRAGSSALPVRDWAVLVYEEKPGEEISRRNFSRAGWSALTECLARVHSLDADDAVRVGPVHEGADPSNFVAFGEALKLRMADLPLDSRRVQAHLEQMAEYIDKNRSAFSIAPRMIHGDLDRQNVVAHGAQIGILDWADLATGDYAFDVAALKFMLDSVAPRSSAELIREQARGYRARFQDDALEVRLRFFMALSGLVHAFQACDDTGSFKPARAWRVRTSYLHSEAQWRSPLKLDGEATGAPAVRTEQWALDIEQPLRGLYYLLAPKRVA